VKYVIIDFEATCVQPQDANFTSEIIEIGAVRLGGVDEPLHDCFQTFVRPVVNAQLTPFCKQLTSIRQVDVDSAPPFRQATAHLRAWLIGPEYNPRYRDQHLFCSWGNYDRNQLRKECGRNNVEYPFSDLHLNIKQEFADFYKFKPAGVTEALKRLGIKFKGTLHRGIDDAVMITTILQHMLRAGYSTKGLQHGYQQQAGPQHSRHA
jgi:inhibitor of KinA sporulation pathway (predicted exonuclease)